MDKYRIDSHKLMYHVRRVSDWQEGKTIPPIYMELSPSGACNHRCSFCGLDFMGYQPRFLDTELFLLRFEELGALGLKSIMYGGEGEPLLHKGIAQLICKAKSVGIDNAITTNGVLLRPELAAEIMPATEWIKVSINAGTKETYAAIHGTKQNDFDIVVANLTQAAKIKRDGGIQCTLGMQMVLLDENAHEAAVLARIARDIGMDYIVIKPHSQHPMGKGRRYEDLKYENHLPLRSELAEIGSDDFKVIFRTNAMRKWDAAEKDYEHCMALPFWSYVDAGGNVWGCSCFLGDDRFLYGNLYEQTFLEIWNGERRLSSLAWVENEMNARSCRLNCRMDEINRYLWDLKHQPPHVNFI
jgi:cyclic pyranopterin phosphate synthase